MRGMGLGDPEIKNKGCLVRRTMGGQLLLGDRRAMPPHTFRHQCYVCISSWSQNTPEKVVSRSLHVARIILDKDSDRDSLS